MLCLSGFELYSRWVPLSKYIENTFKAIQSTFRSLEKHSSKAAL